MLVIFSILLTIMQYVAPKDFSDYNTQNLPWVHRFRLFMGFYNKKTTILWYTISIITFMVLNIFITRSFDYTSATFGDFNYYDTSISNLIGIFFGLFVIFWVFLVFAIPLTPIMLFVSIISFLSGNLESSMQTFLYAAPVVCGILFIRYGAKDEKIEYLRSLHSSFGIKRYRRQRGRDRGVTTSQRPRSYHRQPVPIDKQQKVTGRKMVFCSSCGAKIRASAKYCPKCGGLRKSYKEEQQIDDSEVLTGEELSETQKRLKKEIKAKQKLDKKQDKATVKSIKKEAENLMDNSDILLTRLKGMLKARGTITMQQAAEILEVNQQGLERFLYDAIGKEMIDFNLSITPDNKLKLISSKTSIKRPVMPRQPYSALDDSIGEQKLKTCMICKTPIHGNENYGVCPHCDHEAHSSHFREWLKLKDSCPVCKAKLNLDDVMFFNAKKKS